MEKSKTNRLLASVLDKIRSEDETRANSHDESFDSLSVNAPSSITDDSLNTNLNDSQLETPHQSPTFRIAIFQEFLKPEIFKDLGIIIDQATKPISPVRQEGGGQRILERNVKLFYSPEGTDCSELIFEIEKLGCIQTAKGFVGANGLTPFKDRVIFEYQG